MGNSTQSRRPCYNHTRSKVTFAGDLIEERHFPIVPFYRPMIQRSVINLHNWEVALSQIGAQQPRIVVPGHGNLGGVEIAIQVLDYFKDIRKLDVFI